MKKIFFPLLACLFGLADAGFGQCPAVVPTFSVNVPSVPGQFAYYFQDAIRNSAGELVSVGFKQDVNTNDLQIYFAKFDGNGDPIVSPQTLTFLPPAPKIQSGTLEQKHIFITEAYNASGTPNGYMIAVNLKEDVNYLASVLVVRLDNQGCVVWSQRLRDASDEAVLGCGIHRNGTDDYVVLTKAGGVLNTEVFFINGAGTIVTNKTFGTITPGRMVRLPSNTFGNAVWAICGYPNYGSTIGDIAIALLDANFDEINSAVDVFRPNTSKTSSPALDLAVVGLDVYLIGVFQEVGMQPTTGWLMKLNGIPSSFSTFGVENFNLNWVTEIDMPDVVGVSPQYDMPFDIEAKNDTLAISGWTLQGGAVTKYLPWLLAFRSNGTPYEGQFYGETNSPYGLAYKVLNIPKLGFNMVGLKYSTTGGAARAWVARCDKFLKIGDCKCHNFQTFTTMPSSGAFVSVEDFTPQPRSALKETVQITCQNTPNTKQVCYQPNQPPTPCTADFTFTTNPLCYTASVAATATGTGPFTYSWKITCTGAVFGTGQNTALTFPIFPGIATYPVCLTVTDGSGNTCTVQKNITINGQPPAISCPANLTVTGILNVAGNCTATVTGINPTAVNGFCPPVSQTYTFSGATTASGTGNASGQTFNSGVTTVTYKASDALGQMATCSFTVTVNSCPPPGGLFGTLCGDDGWNVPQKIKAFGNYVYVAGQTVENGQTLGTFSKYDPTTGALVWGFHLDVPSKINDFEYILPSEIGLSGGFLLVGYVEPFGSGADNNSFVIQVIDNGVSPLVPAFNSRRYSLNGRESINRIIRHPNPANPNFPFYAVGVKNPTNHPAPSGFDQTFVMNMGINGNVNFWVDYDFKISSGGDDEFARALFAKKNGNVVFGGNDIPNNDGVLVEISGATGAEVGTYRYTNSSNHDFDIYDGLELPNGEMAIVGEYFTQNRAFMALLKPDFTPYDTRVFSGIDRFTEIGHDAHNHLYSVGKLKPTGFAIGRQIIHRATYSANGLFGFASWYFEDPVEDAWENGRIFVTPAKDVIYYADARRRVSPLFSGLADFNVLVGAFDLNLNSDCRNFYPQPGSLITLILTPDNTNFAAFTPPTPVNNIFGTGAPFICRKFCAPPCSVEVDFTFDQTVCNKVNFTSTATGTGPFTYQWDFRCNGNVDATTANPMFVYSGGGSDNCLTVTDATGCTSVVEFVVNIPPDMVPPVLNCPANATLNTDPSQCCATKNMAATATDNCSTPAISYVLSNGGGTNPNICFDLGTTSITATATDAAGNTAKCTYTVFVQDKQPPALDCPENQSVSVPKCNNGATFVFSPPTATDNCPMALPTIKCSHQSGDFFPCGTTIVSCNAKDASGNTGNCDFSLTVNCQCVTLATSSIECTEDPHVYAFSVTITNQTGGSGCNVSLAETMANASIFYDPTVWSGNDATITGVITVSDPVPDPLEMKAVLECQCPFGPVSCNVDIEFTPPCCEEVRISNREVCPGNDTALVVLENCQNLYDVQQVKWYIGTCPPGAWTLVQVTEGCEPLLLLPEYLTDDVCVFAEVFLGNNPCKKLTSNIATLNYCKELKCVAPDFQHCYLGLPIVNPALHGQVVSDCQYKTEWRDAAGNLLQNGGDYQPPALSFTASPTDCYQDFIYQFRVVTACESVVCPATIRLWNDDAPIGSFAILPPDTSLFCPGEDFELQFTPGCIEPSKTWKWLRGPDAGSLTPISGAGTTNPLLNTNQLIANTWFGVETQNGTCAPDVQKIKILLNTGFGLTNFNAYHFPSCNPTGVEMQTVFTTEAGCNYTIEWYRNGDLVGTTNPTASPATFFLNGVFEGVYYCVIKEDCCDRSIRVTPVELGPKCDLIIAGKCFRCGNEKVDLTGITLNLPSNVHVDAYQWTTNGGIFSSPTNSNSVEVAWAGTYQLHVELDNGCSKTASTLLEQCGPAVGTETPGLENWSVEVYPNPSSGELTLAWTESLPAESRIVLTSVSGEAVRKIEIPNGATKLETRLGNLPTGLYFVRFEVEGRVFAALKVVLE